MLNYHKNMEAQLEDCYLEVQHWSDKYKDLKKDFDILRSEYAFLEEEKGFKPEKESEI